MATSQEASMYNGGTSEPGHVPVPGIEPPVQDFDSFESSREYDADSPSVEKNGARRVTWVTDKEKKLPSPTWHNLKKLLNWDTWDAAFDDQLSKNHEANQYYDHPFLQKSNPES